MPAPTVSQEQLDSAIAIALGAAPTARGFTGLAAGALRLIHGRAWLLVDVPLQSPLRQALAHQLSLLDPQLTLADPSQHEDDSAVQRHLAAALHEAAASTAMGGNGRGCTCVSVQPMAVRDGRQVFVAGHHDASCQFKVAMVRLMPADVKLAEPVRVDLNKGPGAPRSSDEDEPPPRMIAFEDLSEVQQGDLLEVHAPDVLVKVGSSAETGAGLYCRMPPAHDETYYLQENDPPPKAA